MGESSSSLRIEGLAHKRIQPVFSMSRLVWLAEITILQAHLFRSAWLVE